MGLGVVGFLLALLRWWASIPIIVLLGLYSLVLLGDLYAPDLYPKYISEKPGFITSAVIAMVAGITIPFLGSLFSSGRRFNSKIEL
ncbi:hypothetical protein BH10ACI2_BH10ACI2_15480 [soil metagenome]